jgi:cytochrome P450
MAGRYPPGPSDWLFGLGHLRKIKADVLGFYQGLARAHGDSVYLRLGPYPTYLFFHPNEIREVLVTKARHFVKMTHIRRVLRQLDGNGLVISEGDLWLRQRRLVQPAFHPRRFAGYARTIVACTGEMLQRWRQEGPGERDFDREMTGLTLEVVCRTLFGSQLPAEAKHDVGRAVALLSETFLHEFQAPFRLPDWLPLPGKRRKRWAIRLLDGTVRDLIRQRRASEQDAGDLLSMLLLAVDEEGDGHGMSDEQARDEAITLFIAGHDTSAAALAWTWLALARHPEVLERARCEVSEALAGRPPTADDVPRLAFVERVVKEVLRLYPPAIGVFTRQATSEVEIGGYRLPRGSLVQMLSYVTHRDPRWFAAPEKFDPDRFAPGRVEQLPPFAWFPFGGGPRVCVGNSFAMMELVLATAVMLQAGWPTWPEGQAEPVPQAHLSLRPRGGLRLGWKWA